MSDNAIRQILIEEKRRKRKLEGRAEMIDAAGSWCAWISLLAIGFMLSVIGG